MGFDATTTREITRRSGVNKALLYYYFKNKDDLLECVLARYFNRLNRVLLRAAEGEGGLMDRLGAVVDAYVDFFRDHVSFSRIVQRESSGGRHMETIFEHLSPLFQEGLKAVHQAYPDTRSGEMAAQQILISFYGMIVGYFNFAPLLGRLTGTDLLSEESVQLRKRHLRRMLRITTRELAAPDLR